MENIRGNTAVKESPDDIAKKDNKLNILNVDPATLCSEKLDSIVILITNSLLNKN